MDTSVNQALLQTVVVLALLSGSAPADTLDLRKACDHPDGSVRLTAKQARERIRYSEPPKIDGSICLKGKVLVLVVIGPDGLVQCASALTGHPYARQVAVQAVQKWRFDPVVVDGIAVAAFGTVSVDCSWNSQEPPSPQAPN